MLSRRTGLLLLRGTTGIGKTAMLDTVRRRAHGLGFRVLSTAGAEAETTFAFAGLQPLLLDVVGADVEIPEHLRAALLSALGMLDCEIPALETVGLATLTLLTGLAAPASPICLAIDDAHWLDGASAAVIRFVSRRIGADPIVVLATARDGGDPAPDVFPELCLEPLQEAEAEALLMSHGPALPLAARRRILNEAQGNPLGLVELSGALNRALRHPGQTVPQTLPLTERLEAAFVARANALPDETRWALLVAALAPTAVAAEVLAAAASLTGRPVGLPALDVAVTERLIALDGRQIRFSHPLVRSGVVQEATPSRVRAAHQALAEAFGTGERALHHRAEATVGYDDGLAEKLEASSGQALRHGSRRSAVATLAQAALMTTPGPSRAGRLVRAAELSLELGDVDHAREFLQQTAPMELDRPTRATARRLALVLDNPSGDDPRPALEMVALAEEAIDAEDSDGALALLSSGSERVIWGEPGRAARSALVAAALRVDVPRTDPRVTAILAIALPEEAHAELTARLALTDDAQLGDAESALLVGRAALIAGDYDRSGRLLDHAEQRLRAQARLAPLAGALALRGFTALLSGEWRRGAEVTDEAVLLSADTNRHAWVAVAHLTRAGITGVHGDGARHELQYQETERLLRERNATRSLRSLRLMRGMGAVMLGYLDEGVAILSGLFKPDEPGFEVRSCYDALFFLADAAAATGRRETVRAAVETIRVVVPVPWPAALQAAVDYALAVTADDSEVQERLERALAGPARDRDFDRARCELAYGRWLRRQQKRLDARVRLRAARDLFDQLGNDPFAERAREELRATGEASPRRGVNDSDQLSPQEVQIARLVAEGLSNREVGERLFLSHRTVGSHLYRIFPKLGITSRAQLTEAVRSL